MRQRCKIRVQFSTCRFNAERHISVRNRAFNNPDYRKHLWRVGAECLHALHIRVHHLLLRHISISRIRRRDAKLCNISIFSAFISWRTDYWCCSSARRYRGKLKISPEVIQISILKFTRFLLTKKKAFEIKLMNNVSSSIFIHTIAPLQNHVT